MQFNKSIGIAIETEGAFGMNLTPQREKTLVHLVEDKLFERSIRSNTKSYRRPTIQDKAQYLNIDEDPMKNLKASLMHSIV